MKSGSTSAAPCSPWNSHRWSSTSSSWSELTAWYSTLSNPRLIQQRLPLPAVGGVAPGQHLQHGGVGIPAGDGQGQPQPLFQVCKILGKVQQAPVDLP